MRILFHAEYFSIPCQYSLDGIFLRRYIHRMKWVVEYTDEFELWWSGLTEDEQVSVAASDQMA
jgi:hypothetical protein